MRAQRDQVCQNGAGTNGAGAHSDTLETVLMLAFSVVQVVLSLFPGLELSLSSASGSL
jgi:hypothetical protein